MKRILLFAGLVLSTIGAGAQFYLTTGYSAAIPRRDMGKNIATIHFINLGAAWRLPDQLRAFELNADLGYGLYGNTRKMQTFTFNNGTSTQTFVNYNSSAALAAMGLRYHFFPRKNISPYLGVRTGYMELFSSVYVEDPRDPFGCRALENEGIISDGNWFRSWNSGIKIDWNLFGKKTRKRFGWIDIGVQQTNGGALSYINTKRLQNAAATAAGARTSMDMHFINASTQDIHEHQVAEVYKTPIRMLEFRISAVFSFNVFKQDHRY